MGNPRISGRRGQVADLDVSFLHNRVLTDPFAIRHVDIYRTSVVAQNLVATVPFIHPSDPNYPAPAVKAAVGKYVLPFGVPVDFSVPDVYFDVWSYYAANPCPGETGTESGPDETAGEITECDLDDPTLLDQLLSCCHRFWLYPDGWLCADELQTIEFGFEPLAIHFTKPEVRPLQIGIMPLPLYDFDANLVLPLIPFLQATISVETRDRELLIDKEVMTIGLRQGSYRTNPYVLRWNLDTSRFLAGTYRYKVLLSLPDGTTRSSKSFYFTVAI